MDDPTRLVMPYAREIAVVLWKAVAIIGLCCNIACAQGVGLKMGFDVGLQGAGFNIGIGPTGQARKTGTPFTGASVCPCGCGKVGCQCSVVRQQKFAAAEKEFTTIKEADKHLIYVYSFDGCGPCAKFADDLAKDMNETADGRLADGDVHHRLNGQYKYVIVKLKKDGSDWEQHKVQFCPTFRHADLDVPDVVGYPPPTDREEDGELVKDPKWIADTRARFLRRLDRVRSRADKK